MQSFVVLLECESVDHSTFRMNSARHMNMSFYNRFEQHYKTALNTYNYTFTLIYKIEIIIMTLISTLSTVVIVCSLLVFLMFEKVVMANGCALH
jgi:hypothetical protein